VACRTFMLLRFSGWLLHMDSLSRPSGGVLLSACRQPTFLFHQSSGLCRSVVDLDLQHWIVGLQLAGCLFGGTFVRKLGFEMPIDHYRVANRRRDISPLNISGLWFFDVESWLFHVHYFCAI